MFRGDFGKLIGLRARLDRLRSKSTASTIVRAMSTASVVLVRTGIEKRQDAYGAKWAKSEVADAMTTPSLARSFRAERDAMSFTLKTPAPAAKPLQHGQTFRPQNNRAITPIDIRDGFGCSLSAAKRAMAAARRDAGIGLRGRKTKRSRKGAGGKRRGDIHEIVVPRRTMVPEPRFGGIGARWDRAFSRAATKVFASRFLFRR